MGDIVRLNVPFRQPAKMSGQAALVTTFATQRRHRDDVFWMKENAELLNVLETTGSLREPDALALHLAFYEDIENRLGFFPQYYRFLLSICLDLEDLGIGGAKSEKLVHWVVTEGLAEAELSDLQRAEARRLCLRRGIDPLPHDAGLNDRLRGFARRSATFAMPNKKAAYELTHIVFYLSEYGRRDPGLDEVFLDSLVFAGTLAFLDMNLDLLSEICIALRFAGATPPDIWERWIRDQAARFRINSVDAAAGPDDYHSFLMVNWHLALAGQGGFSLAVPEGPLAFRHVPSGQGPLRELSECMYGLGDRRSADWLVMKAAIHDKLSSEARSVLALAEAATDRFDAFFAGFARTGLARLGGDRS